MEEVSQAMQLTYEAHESLSRATLLQEEDEQALENAKGALRRVFADLERLLKSQLEFAE